MFKKSTCKALLAVSLMGTMGLAYAAIPVFAEGMSHSHPARMDIVDTAVQAGQFKTLAAALTAAGLVDVLKGDTNFTVFAPTDAAFAQLPEGTLETLLKPENKEQLANILKYHVVPGSVEASEVVMKESVQPLYGSALPVNTDNGVFVGDARVVKTDIGATNGVIHVIDKVLLPQ